MAFGNQDQRESQEPRPVHLLLPHLLSEARLQATSGHRCRGEAPSQLTSTPVPPCPVPLSDHLEQFTTFSGVRASSPSQTMGC